MCLPGGASDRVVHGGNGQLEQRALARDGRTWRRPRRAPRIRCWGRCAWWRGGAAPARRDRRGNRAGRSSARLILQLVPSMRNLRMAATKSPRQVARLQQPQERDLGIEVGGDQPGFDLLAVLQHHAARAPAAHQDLRYRRARCGSRRPWRARWPRWLPKPRPCRRARSPTARDARPRRPCSGAAGCRPCPASAVRRWRRSRRRWPA